MDIINSVSPGYEQGRMSATRTFQAQDLVNDRQPEKSLPQAAPIAAW